MTRTLIMISLVCIALSAPSARADSEPPDLGGATDIDRYSEYNYETLEEYCRNNHRLSDLFKDIGNTLQIETVAMTAGVLSDAEEIRIGRQVYGLIRRDFDDETFDSDEEMVEYLNALLQDVLAYSSRPGLDWTIHLIDAPVFNAFATPGGHIYFFTGMLDHMSNEAQLVSIIAHEVGHVELRHTVDFIQYLKLLGAWDDDTAETIESNLGVNLLQGAFLPFRSRSEEAADTFSSHVMFQMGYSNHQAARFMSMADMVYGEIPPQLDESFASFLLIETENLLTTHPPMRDRACRVMRELRLRAPRAGEDPISYVGARNYQERVPRSKSMY